MWKRDRWWKTERPIVLFPFGVGFLLVAGFYLYEFATGIPLNVFEWGTVVTFPLYGVLFLLRAKYEIDR